MTETPALHPSIVALVSLAAGIAAKHPDMGLCQVDRLRVYGVPQAHIDAVVEIARHIRDEAGQKLDAAFDAKTTDSAPTKLAQIGVVVAAEGAACCSPTPTGQRCC